MEIDTNVPKNKLVLSLIGLFLFLFIFSVLPDNWFKSKTAYSKDTQEDSLTLLNKKLSKDYLNAPSDTSRTDSVPNWKKALLDSVDPSIINATRTKEQLEKQKDLDDPNNLTSQVAKNSYTISTYLAQQGADLDKKTLETISQNIVNDSLESIKKDSKVYTKSNFKITTKNDSKTLKTYGNELVIHIYGVFVAGTKSGYKNEIETLNDYYKENDATILKKYDPQITAFKKLRDDLLKMTVPESMIDLHVKETNMIESYLNTLIIFSRTNHDPLRTVVEIEKYRENLQNFYMIIKEYNQMFIKQNIYFTKNESGYVLFNERMANFEFK